MRTRDRPVSDGDDELAAVTSYLPLVGRVAHRERSERCDGRGAAAASELFAAAPRSTPQPALRVMSPLRIEVKKRRPAMANETARALRKRLTRQEVKLWVKLRELKPLGFHFRRQAPIGPYIVDFVSFQSRLVIEADGGQHGTDEGAQSDQARDAFLKSQGSKFCGSGTGISTSIWPESWKAF